MDDELKPRKVINRLPDLDIWMICENGKIAQAKEMLVRKFIQEEMYTFDVDPPRTMREISLIAGDLISGKMTDKYLPHDIHAIEHSKFVNIL